MYVPKDKELRAWHEASERERVEAHIRKISKRLHEMADKIDQDCERGHYIQPIHELMWGLANLGLDSLAQAIHDHAQYATLVIALDTPAAG